MTPEQKKEIDDMSYEAMLSLCRYAPTGHPMFIGQRGKHFLETMLDQRKLIGEAAHTKASKSIGWDDAY